MSCYLCAVSAVIQSQLVLNLRDKQDNYYIIIGGNRAVHVMTLHIIEDILKREVVCTSFVWEVLVDKVKRVNTTNPRQLAEVHRKVQRNFKNIGTIYFAYEGAKMSKIRTLWYTHLIVYWRVYQFRSAVAIVLKPEPLPNCSLFRDIRPIIQMQKRV